MVLLGGTLLHVAFEKKKQISFPCRGGAQPMACPQMGLSQRSLCVSCRWPQSQGLSPAGLPTAPQTQSVPFEVPQSAGQAAGRSFPEAAHL